VWYPTLMSAESFHPHLLLENSAQSGRENFY
jgi:hypothetical protein